MRIDHSWNYYHRYGNCPLGDNCERFYCKEHRYLYRFCETDDGYGISGDCPRCIAQARTRRAKEYAARTADSR